MSDEEESVIASLIEEWGFKVRYGVEYPGTEYENMLFRCTKMPIAGQIKYSRYIRLKDNILTVETVAGTALASVCLEAPGSLDELKNKLEDFSEYV